MTSKEFGKILQDKLTSEYGVELNVASNQQIYRSLALICRQMMSENHKKFQSKAIGTGTKQVYYLCMEFLMGRSLKMSLFNLGLDEVAKKALADADINLDSIFEEEPDAGLGNGGLGRLAACYLDGMATTGICGTGYSILYEYGIFKQKIVDGWQQERADNWLPGGQVWLKSHPDQAIEVRFDGEIRENWDHGFHYIQHTNYNSVMAVPSDMYVQGYDGKGVAKLRLWQAKAPDFDMSSFSLGNYNTAMSKNASAELISKVLYPNDNHVEGKILRLRQQYFLSAASIGDIVQNHLATYGTLENLADKVAIQLNDTHPTVAVPELMRILMDVEGLGWDEAWEITTKTCAYTNHTIMAEALEKWPVDLFSRLLPRIYQIVEEINRRFVLKIQSMYPGNQDKVKNMAILYDGQVKMAHLAIAGSYSVNGVAALHTKILEERELKDFYEMRPEQFNNKTNGITQRRFLLHGNPLLASWITDKIGDEWIVKLSNLKKLKVYATDEKYQQEFMNIKYQNKIRLANYIKEHNGVDVDPRSIFDVQVKRLHEYKRQLLNILHVMYQYNELKTNPSYDMYPTTYIFGAKASAGYKRAKLIIKLINSVADVINNDASIKGKIKVVFIENYRVSNAELIFAAADVSEQISTASREASGTGNMKFMLNGAVTLGTMDGANVEIVEEVGEENAVIFGLRAEEVMKYEREGGYNPKDIYNNDAAVRTVLTQLINGMYSSDDPDRFRDLYDSLINEDVYFILKDFASYVEAHRKIDTLYRDEKNWAKMVMLNTACSGKFSSDRTIEEYAKEIWNLKKVKVTLD